MRLGKASGCSARRNRRTNPARMGVPRCLQDIVRRKARERQTRPRDEVFGKGVKATFVGGRL